MSADDIQRTVSVTGVGRVAAVADLLVVNLAVETQGATASDALADNNKQAAAVLSALRDHGIQERDIQTTQLSIDPVLERQDSNETRPPKIVGYRVRNGLSATLRDVRGAGAVIDAVVHAGGDATRIEGISFSFADPARLLTEARKRAIDDARVRAHQLADGLGVRLGNVISVTESDLSGGRTIQAFAAATVVLPGESEVSLQISISYEIFTK
ncbi:MAG: SIMPL domain-containing protein [Pseudonocardiaceae bacterium]